jgi:hypothetical protein
MNSLFRDYQLVLQSGLFDPQYYRSAYPDVARRNIDPLMHYLEEGARAARNPHPDFDAAFYLVQCRRQGHKPENPLLHYLTVGIGLGFKTRPDGEAAAQGEAAPGESAAFGRPPMILHVDDVAVARDGILRVEGWVVCLAPIAAVEVLVDGTLLGVAEHGRARADVAQTRSGYPDARRAGFLFVGDASRFGAGAKAVTIRATAQTGIMRELVHALDMPELQPGAIPGDEPVRYHLDHVALTTAGQLSLTGWAVASSPTMAIAVSIDGRKVGEAETGLRRGDVGNLFPAIPHARLAGFAVEWR